MPTETKLKPELCNCLAVRQAARHVTQFYDQFLAPAGLRTTQFSILARLQRLGPMTISVLAADLVMDRTTLGRNLQPLEREGLVAVVKGRTDRRSREIRLTDTGVERLRAGRCILIAGTPARGALKPCAKVRRNRRLTFEGTCANICRISEVRVAADRPVY